MTTVSASSITEEELEQLDSVRNLFPEGTLKKALGTLSSELHRGEDVSFFSESHTLTPSEAAKVLKLSRTHLYKILESGALPFHVVGVRDKRINARDLLAYRTRLHAAQKSTAFLLTNKDAIEDAALEEMMS